MMAQTVAGRSLSSDARSTGGIILLTVVAVEYGGIFMLRVLRGRVPATPSSRRSSAPATPTRACS